MAETKKTPLKSDKKKKNSFMQEFKDFISRGNIVELAIGLTVGTAFTKVVTSLVNNLIMPPIGLLLNGESFAQLFITLNGSSYSSLSEAEAAGAPIMKYGQLLADLIDFFIIAVVIFIIIKLYKRVGKKD